MRRVLLTFAMLSAAAACAAPISLVHGGTSDFVIYRAADAPPSVLAAADKRLSEVRRHVPDAGGLVIASNQTAARAYAKLLQGITGVAPTVTSLTARIGSGGGSGLAHAASAATPANKARRAAGRPSPPKVERCMVMLVKDSVRTENSAKRGCHPLQQVCGGLARS